MGQSCEAPRKKCWHAVAEGREAIQSWTRRAVTELQELEDEVEGVEAMGMRQKMHKKAQDVPEGMTYQELQHQRFEEKVQQEIERHRLLAAEEAHEANKHHAHTGHEHEGSAPKGGGRRAIAEEVAHLGHRAHVVVTGKLPEIPENPTEKKQLAMLGLSMMEELVEDHFVVLQSRKGASPFENRPNQDDMFFMQTADMYRIVGIFDGHGEEGHSAAAIVRAHMMRTLVADVPFDRNSDIDKYNGQIAHILKEAFKAAHKELVHQKEVDVTLSGVTATICIHDVKTGWLHVGWVGNCRAILGDMQETHPGDPARRIAKRTQLIAAPFTADHTSRNEHERDRLLKAGAALPAASKGDLCEVCVPGERFPGIPVTRCIGNKIAQAIGVSHEPSVQHREVIEPKKEARFVFIGSDGVWDMLRNSEVVMTVHESRKGNLDFALDHVLSKAEELWMKKGAKQGNVMDDITGGLLWLKGFENES